jgi:scyllo-inositol 2-dehydrogenase (NAD+)
VILPKGGMTMSQPIRCAVLGLGRLGMIHVKNLAGKISGAQLVHVVDPLERRAEQVAREFGVPKWSKDPGAVFEDPSVDAVVIVTSTSTHAEMIALAAKSGKHIFTEKPITQTLEEADAVIRLIRDNNVVCQVGFMRRFDPAFMEARRRILAGEIGKPIYFKGLTRDNPPGKYPISPPIEFIKHSGGIFLDLSIHDFDLARYLMGSEVQSVRANGKVLVHSFMEECNDVDQAITYLQFDSGAAGDIESSRNSPYGFDVRCEIIGTEGAIAIGSIGTQGVTAHTAIGSHHAVPIFASKFQDAYLFEMIHFIDCLQKKEYPTCTELDGKAALAIALAAKKSFRTGRPVTTKELELDAAETTKY